MRFFPHWIHVLRVHIFICAAAIKKKNVIHKNKQANPSSHNVQESLMFYCTITQLPRGMKQEDYSNTKILLVYIDWHLIAHFSFAFCWAPDWSQIACLSFPQCLQYYQSKHGCGYIFLKLNFVWFLRHYHRPFLFSSAHEWCIYTWSEAFLTYFYDNRRDIIQLECKDFSCLQHFFRAS